MFPHPRVQVELVTSPQTSQWLVEETADFCGVEPASVSGLLNDYSGVRSWLQAIADEATVLEVLAESTTDERRRVLLAQDAQHVAMSATGRDTMRQVWEVVTSFGWAGVERLQTLKDTMSAVDPQVLDRVVIEVEGEGKFGFGEARTLDLAEGERRQIHLSVLLGSGQGIAVAAQLTLVSGGPDDVPEGATLVSAPLVVSVTDGVTLADAGIGAPQRWRPDATGLAMASI